MANLLSKSVSREESYPLVTLMDPRMGLTHHHSVHTNVLS